MTFTDFCRLHGVLIDTLPPVGVWKRYRTEDKPQHRNGAVKYMGDHGFCQNHASMHEVAVWRAEGVSQVAQQEVRRVAQQASQDIARGQQQAAQRAAEILRACRIARHPYMASKGFPEESVNVWSSDKGDLMVVPMRVGSQLVGCQTITEAGDKKFLYGQRCSNAAFVFSAGNGIQIVCEGYATGLSVRLAMARLKRPYSIHICFSAGNMKKVAENLASGFVLADNDASKTAEKVAEEIGWPYLISDRVGEDFNDWHQRIGLFAVSQKLVQFISSSKVAA